MKKLLLTGASGFLGWNICQVAKTEWEVYGLVHKVDIKIPGVVIRKLNLTDKASLKKIFGEINPNAVIHTAAISDANYCQQHPDESYTINVTATITIAGLCVEKKIPFVFTSSDLVFDGKKGNYKETDDVNPVSKYGEQKVEAEQAVASIYPDAAVCRMPLMIGDGGPLGKGNLHSFMSNLKKGQVLKLFTDEFRSPLGGESAATGLLLALKHFKGVYHLGGKQRMSRYELGEKILEAFNLRAARLIPAKQNEVKMSAPRPSDVSLNSSKAYMAGFRPKSIFDELKELAIATQDIPQNSARSHTA